MGLPRRHARRPRGRGVRRLRGARLGRRARRRCCATGPLGPGMVQLWHGAGRRARTWSTLVPEGAVPAGLPARPRRVRRPRPAGLAGARGHRAAAPDGGLRRRRQQRRPQGRPRAARWPTGTGTASTTASASTSSDKLRTVLWGWAGEPLDRRGRRRACERSPTACAGRALRRARSATLLTEREVDATPRRVRAAAARRARMPVPGGRLAVHPVAAVLSGRPDRLPGMRAWTCPDVPRPCPSAAARRCGSTTPPRRRCVDATPRTAPARMYVCGITPYDATHLGHAATYVAFDLLNRAWRDAGHEVRYVQNVTDVDDPLLERAAATGEDWVELAERETELFREDMAALRVLAARRTTSARSSRSRWSSTLVAAAAASAGAVYDVDGDVYFSVRADPRVRRGVAAGPATQMLDGLRRARRRPRPARQEGPARLPALAGRAPGRAGLGQRRSGRGRPGWHIECAAIALRPPRRATSTSRAAAATWSSRTTRCAPSEAQVADRRRAVRPGLRARRDGRLDGEKMSKSKGNLVFVSRLRADGVDPMAIRLALLAHHYRSDWEWTDAELWPRPSDRLARWRAAVGRGAGAPAAPVVDDVLRRAGRRPRRPARAGRRRPLGRRDARHRADGAEPAAPALRSCRDAGRRRARASRSEPLDAAYRAGRPVVVLAALEVALELPGDGLAAGLGQLGGVAGLLERADVVARRPRPPRPARRRRAPRRGRPRAGRRAGCCTSSRSSSWPSSASVAFGHGGCGDVVRDRGPERHRRDVEPRAGVLEDADDAGRALVRRLLELEPVDEVGLGRRAGDRDRPGVRGVGEQRAEGDHQLAAELVGRRPSSSAQNCRQRMFGSMPRSRITSRCEPGGGRRTSWVRGPGDPAHARSSVADRRAG